MTRWAAPAKLNLSLRVGARDGSGFHPLHSLVQTIEWYDEVTVTTAEEDQLRVEGAELPEGGGNLAWKAVEVWRRSTGSNRPRLAVSLSKRLPVAAGLGGGSSDAAAVLAALADLSGGDHAVLPELAAAVGSDVPFLLRGGTALMEGRGERLTPRPPLSGFAVAVAVPPFELVTAEVYAVWDQLEGPEGPSLDGRVLPPALRHEAPLVNDLTPAARRLRPELGDWMDELARRWERRVAMSGSGPACFAFFTDLDEAAGAAADVPPSRAVAAAELRATGVAPLPE